MLGLICRKSRNRDLLGFFVFPQYVGFTNTTVVYNKPMNKEKIYRDGFVDGMRNCGFLLVDVKDESLELKEEWKQAIQEGLEKRNYSHEGRTQWQFIKDIVLENDELKRRHEYQDMVIESLHKTIDDLLANRHRIIDEKMGVLDQ